VTATYDKVLFSEQYSKLAGNMVDEMSRFKLAFDELCEAYLANFPVAKKSDMDALAKTVHELKKEVQELKKEIKKNDKRDK
jgi:polyhydroxyalkanoate synthesis regulator phasin